MQHAMFCTASVPSAVVVLPPPPPHVLQRSPSCSLFSSSRAGVHGSASEASLRLLEASAVQTQGAAAPCIPLELTEAQVAAQRCCNASKAARWAADAAAFAAARTAATTAAHSVAHCNSLRVPSHHLGPCSPHPVLPRWCSACTAAALLHRSRRPMPAAAQTVGQPLQRQAAFRRWCSCWQLSRTVWL